MRIFTLTLTIAAALTAACGGRDDSALFGDNDSIRDIGGRFPRDAGTGGSSNVASTSGGNGGSAGAQRGNADASYSADGSDSADSVDASYGTGGSVNVPDAEAEVNACPSGMKRCGGICAFPSPPLGCSLSDCQPCPAPPVNGMSTCIAEQCDFQCDPGFVRIGASCIPHL